MRFSLYRDKLNEPFVLYTGSILSAGKMKELVAHIEKERKKKRNHRCVYIRKQFKNTVQKTFNSVS
jgi:hypothetical protein